MHRMILALALALLAAPRPAAAQGPPPSEQQLLEMLADTLRQIQATMAEQESELLGAWDAAGAFLARCSPRFMTETHAGDTLRRITVRAAQNARLAPAASNRFRDAAVAQEAALLAIRDRWPACTLAARMIDDAKDFLDRSAAR